MGNTARSKEQVEICGELGSTWRREVDEHGFVPDLFGHPPGRGNDHHRAAVILEFLGEVPDPALHLRVVPVLVEVF